MVGTLEGDIIVQNIVIDVQLFCCRMDSQAFFIAPAE